MGGRAARWWTRSAPTAGRSAALLLGRAVAPADKGGASGTPLALVPHRPLLSACSARARHLRTRGRLSLLIMNTPQLQTTLIALSAYTSPPRADHSHVVSQDLDQHAKVCMWLSLRSSESARRLGRRPERPARGAAADGATQLPPRNDLTPAVSIFFLILYLLRITIASVVMHTCTVTTPPGMVVQRPLPQVRAPPPPHMTLWGTLASNVAGVMHVCTAVPPPCPPSCTSPRLIPCPGSLPSRLLHGSARLEATPHTSLLPRGGRCGPCKPRALPAWLPLASFSPPSPATGLGFSRRPGTPGCTLWSFFPSAPPLTHSLLPWPSSA